MIEAIPMLPDFPELKSKFATRIIRKFQATRAATIHIFDEVPKISLHEGKRFIIVLEDGTEREIEMKTLSVQYSVSDQEYKRLTQEELGRKIEEAAIEMGQKQLELAYKEIDRTVSNIVDARGEPLSPKHILQGLETIQIDFDAQGRPKLPSVVIHPDMFEGYKRAIQDIESTPELKKRFAEIIATKKEEWRARESNRKLVG